MAKGVDIKELLLVIRANQQSIKSAVNTINNTIKSELKRTVDEVNKTVSSGMKQTENVVQKSVSAINKTIGTIAKAFAAFKVIQKIIGIFKGLTDVGGDMAEVQHVINETFGDSAGPIEEFAKTARDAYGLSELSAKRYISTMGAMFKSMGFGVEAARDLSLGLTKVSADMASFYNLDSEEVFKKMRSGLTGQIQPLRQLGINMTAANLEQYALTNGMEKAYNAMSEQEKVMLRYNYILNATKDAHGDFAKTNKSWTNQLQVLKLNLENIRVALGQAFIAVLRPLLIGFNQLLVMITAVTERFSAFVQSVFGKSESSGGVVNSIAGAIDYIGESVSNAGKKASKAVKEVRKVLGGFDELVSLNNDKADNGGLVSGGGGGGLVSIPTPEIGEVDTEAAEGSINSFIQRAKDSVRGLLESLGINNIFSGIQEGLDLINFDGIKKNLRAVFEGWGEIGATAFEGLKTMAQPAGEAIGTLMKYGLASRGNIFESITLGFSNFTTNNKEKIQEWLNETSTTMANGLTNLGGIFENLGSIWLGSLEKYKEEIAGSIEDLLTNIANSVALRGTIWADTFEIITGRIKQFTEENSGEIQAFTDSLMEMFTGAMEILNTVWADTTTSIGKFWDEWGEGIVNTFMDVVDDIGGWLLYLWNDLVKPIWDTLMGYMSDLWENNLSGLVDGLLEFLGKVSEFLSALWNLVSPFFEVRLKVLVEGVKIIVGILLGYGKEIIAGVADTVGGILKALGGVLDFLTGVFTGDWGKAWEGIKNIFGGVMDAIGAIFKLPINSIIGGINGFIRGINKIQVPDWVPIVGGKALKYQRYLSSQTVVL